MQQVQLYSPPPTQLQQESGQEQHFLFSWQWNFPQSMSRVRKQYVMPREAMMTMTRTKNMILHSFLRLRVGFDQNISVSLMELSQRCSRGMLMSEEVRVLSNSPTSSTVAFRLFLLLLISYGEATPSLRNSSMISMNLLVDSLRRSLSCLTKVKLSAMKLSLLSRFLSDRTSKTTYFICVVRSWRRLGSFVLRLLGWKSSLQSASLNTPSFSRIVLAVRSIFSFCFSTILRISLKNSNSLRIKEILSIFLSLFSISLSREKQFSVPLIKQTQSCSFWLTSCTSTLTKHPWKSLNNFLYFSFTYFMDESALNSLKQKLSGVQDQRLECKNGLNSMAWEFHPMDSESEQSEENWGIFLTAFQRSAPECYNAIIYYRSIYS